MGRRQPDHPDRPEPTRRTPRPADGLCETCGRDKPLTFHHLIPRKNHRRDRFRRLHTLAEMRSRGLHLCRDCHAGIHDLIPSERELGERFNTREALLAHEGFARHVAWVKKRK